MDSFPNNYQIFPSLVTLITGSTLTSRMDSQHFTQHNPTMQGLLDVANKCSTQYVNQQNI